MSFILPALLPAFSRHTDRQTDRWIITVTVTTHGGPSPELNTLGRCPICISQYILWDRDRLCHHPRLTDVETGCRRWVSGQGNSHEAE